MVCDPKEIRAPTFLVFPTFLSPNSPFRLLRSERNFLISPYFKLSIVSQSNTRPLREINHFADLFSFTLGCWLFHSCFGFIQFVFVSVLPSFWCAEILIEHFDLPFSIPLPFINIQTHWPVTCSSPMFAGQLINTVFEDIYGMILNREYRTLPISAEHAVLWVLILTSMTLENWRKPKIQGPISTLTEVNRLYNVIVIWQSAYSWRDEGRVKYKSKEQKCGYKWVFH